MSMNTNQQTNTPFRFQTVVYDLFQSNRDVLLQAPPGAGKTRAAIEPAIAGFTHSKLHLYPQKLLYAVPMRTLAKGFYQQNQTHASKSSSKPVWNKGWASIWNPTIQTGAMPEDPLLEGRIIFLTVDQLLASFLTLPYGLPRRLDNINTGALVGSYLVFDEFHLYPAQEMMLSVLALCRMLKGISRFILMSATFSAPFLQAIAQVLEAETVVDEPGLNLFADVTPIQTQTRTWQAVDEQLTAQAVRQRLGQRTLVICNQVERTQQLYQDLKQTLPDEYECTLLHSRFYKTDRQLHEQKLTPESFEKNPRPQVMVATQVVEVGLDLSATTLLTECAPAASLIQRAGRCARRENEAGDVYVFPPRDAEGKINYAPYGTGDDEDGMQAICERTWETLNQSDFQKQVVGYRKEQILINQTHGAADESFVDGLDAKIDARIDAITQCLANRDNGYLPTFIRSQSNVSLFIDPDPKKDSILTSTPHQRESFGVSRGQLFHYFNALLEADPQIEGEFWLMGCTGLPENAESEADGFEAPRYAWKPIRTAQEIYDYRWFVAHPQVLDYTVQAGLRFRLPHLDQPAIISPIGAKKSYEYKPYVGDTYIQHLSGLYLAYTNEFGAHAALRKEALYGLTALCKQMGIPPEEGERLLRLTLALHDVGKLNKRWQAWAAAWQTAYAQHISPPTVSAADGPLAHTDYDRRDALQEQLKKDFKHKPRGSHAVESAEASLPIIREVCQGDRHQMAIIISAIMRHHTPDADHCEEFHLSDGTMAAVTEVLRRYGFADDAERWSQMLKQQFNESGKSVQISPRIVEASYENWRTALLYYLFVRVLRLADQRAGEYWHRYGDLKY
jgi:CRISPR-associated endonuclease/helicase Cas3